MLPLLCLPAAKKSLYTSFETNSYNNVNIRYSNCMVLLQNFGFSFSFYLLYIVLKFAFWLNTNIFFMNVNKELYE